ncbi:MAG: hypothetical protein HQL52_13050 [Magnetococcales bacterium]|nr:hypothetical protein [Magnetococcales bacterium]
MSGGNWSLSPANWNPDSTVLYFLPAILALIAPSIICGFQHHLLSIISSLVGCLVVIGIYGGNLLTVPAVIVIALEGWGCFKEWLLEGNEETVFLINQLRSLFTV